MKKLKNKNRLFEIYTHSEVSFTVGEIISEDTEFVFIKSYDTLGRESAYYLIRKFLINDMKKNTKYLKKIDLYRDYWNKQGDLEIHLKDIKFDESEPFINQAIEYAIDSGDIVMIGQLEEEYEEEILDIGYLEQLSKDSFNLKCIDLETAKISKNLEILLDNIILMEIGSIENELLKYANKNLK